MLCLSFASPANILLKVYFFAWLSSLLCRCILRDFEIRPQVFVVSPSCLTRMLFPSRYLAVATPGLRHCPFVGHEPAPPPPPAAAAPPSPPPPPKPTVLRRGRNLPRCPPPAASGTAHRLAQSVHPVTGRLCVASPLFYVVGFIARCVTRQWPNLALWQVTKKRVSANKKNQETQEFYNAAQAAARNQSQRGQHAPASQSQAQKEKVVQEHQQHTTSSSPTPGDAVAATAAAMCTPPRQNMPATGHTPGSASKRKHRKLAVNFEAAKVSE